MGDQSTTLLWTRPSLQTRCVETVRRPEVGTLLWGHGTDCTRRRYSWYRLPTFDIRLDVGEKVVWETIWGLCMDLNASKMDRRRS